MIKFASEKSEGTEFRCILEGALRKLDSATEVDSAEPV